MELGLGKMTATGDLEDTSLVPMKVIGASGQGAEIYESAAVLWHQSGFCGYTARVLPRHADLGGKFKSGLVTWAELMAQN